MDSSAGSRGCAIKPYKEKFVNMRYSPLTQDLLLWQKPRELLG